MPISTQKNMPTIKSVLCKSVLKKICKSVLFLTEYTLSPAIVPITGYKFRYTVLIYHARRERKL
jgi:hypothetical protein